ncbi:hypothetical protein [Micromonospora sp. LOL_023]|uniref:hypothetical protein n=1 Tax=Micromonospora sp. LOL_023 TaxID=3345418 RepID=UPI003A8495D1
MAGRPHSGIGLLAQCLVWITVPPSIGVDSPEAYWALPRSVPAELLAAAVADDDVVHPGGRCPGRRLAADPDLRAGGARFGRRRSS